MIAFKVDMRGLEKAMHKTPEGQLRLGPTAVSLDPMGDLELGREVELRDYLMEGFVTFGLRKLEFDGAAWIEVVPHGTNRDRYLRSHVRWLLKSAGIEQLAEMRDDGTVDVAAS